MIRRAAAVTAAFLVLAPLATATSVQASSTTSVQTPVCRRAPHARATCFAVRLDRMRGGRVQHATTPVGYTPADLQEAYQLPSATAGGGMTVAIVDAYDDPSAEADLRAYRSEFGLPPCTSRTRC